MAPTITFLEPRELTVVQFEEAVFSCNATARPRPTINWFRVETDGNLTDVSGLSRTTATHIEIEQTDISSQLTVRTALPSDAGEYICQADNVLNSDEEFSYLMVNGEYKSKHGVWYSL